jgi:hypothetical protein
LRHHGGDASPSRRTIEKPDGGTTPFDGKLVEMAALGADRAVGMSTTRGEVVGAHDARSPRDRAPAADVIGRREVDDATR